MSEELYALAIEARKKAHAKESNFPVGVALRTRSGRIFTGANIENQSYPEGWCAETTALSHMVMAAETPEDREVVEVCVVADLAEPITPCGGCRQRLKEFSTGAAVVHSGDLTGVKRSATMAELLPFAFALTKP